ncbi:MAG: EAL domain-containing protein, partial [Candidatus Sulfotelmatobacter sp.]
VSKANAGLEERVMERTGKLHKAIKRLQLQAAALEAAANSIVITDNTGTITWVNRAFTTMTGYSKEEAMGRTPRLLKSDEQPEAYYAELWSTISSGKVWKGEIVNRRKDGTTYTEEMTITPVSQGEGRDETQFIAIKQDISGRKQAEQALRRAEEKYRAIFEDAVIGIFQASADGRLLNVNRAFAEIHGYDSPEQMLVELSNLNAAAQLFVEPKRMDVLRQVLGEKELVRDFELDVYRRDRSERVVLVNVRAVRDASGNMLFYEGTVEDVTARKVAEERVQFLAYYDALTGLPNRTLLQDRLATALAGARRRKDKVALLFLDLDRFKLINDSLGHSFGDLLLQEVAQRLKKWAREQDTVARLGGDEFLIVLTGVKNIADAAVAADRMTKSMTAGFVVQGRPLNITCSLGISVFPEHGTNSETLIKNADAAMYFAKESGRNNFRFFTKDLSAQAVERLTLENSLRPALEKNEFFLMYQPQVDIGTGRIIGLEALLRWQHPNLGLVPPDKFIQIAENVGLIVPIGEWVLRTACSQARKWQDEGLPAVMVAVNISAIQFRQKGFCKLIRKVLDETGLPAKYLELELTESLLLDNADLMLSVVEELKAMGVTLAIDDFGTGYSSLSYLKHFPVSKLKIDRSFVRDVAVNPDDAAITTAIISMAKSLNLKVIAEGVEDEAQMSFLRAQRCDEIQGYYFSKPLAVDKVAEKLRGNTSEQQVRAQAIGRQS